MIERTLIKDQQPPDQRENYYYYYRENIQFHNRNKNNG